jgi:hypothetical protein
MASSSDATRERTILVGNGPILDPNLGSFIDSFDRVVRFNDYAIEGYEDAVGTKITDWFIAILLILPEHRPPVASHMPLVTDDRLVEIPNMQRVLIRCGPRVMHDLLARLHMLFGPILPDPIRFMGKRPHKIIPEERRVWMSDAAGVWDRVESSTAPAKRPSTGMLAIMLFLEQEQLPLRLVGFGPRNEFANCHYYNDWKHVTHHWDLERKILNEWEDAGFVERCDV